MIEFNKHFEYVIDLNYDLTLFCNNRCPYCYALGYLDNNKKINEEVFYEVIKQTNVFMENNPEYDFRMTVLGGEPFMVVDRLVELIESVPDRVIFNIHSNINYDYSVLARVLKFPNVHICASWHFVSDLDRVRSNTLRFIEDGGSIEIGFLLDDETVDLTYEHVQWAIDNNVEFTFDGIRSADGNADMFSGFGTEKYQQMVLKGREIRRKNRNVEHQRDDTVDGMREDELKEISSIYYTFCKICQYKVDWGGKLHSVCGYDFEHHIKDGIKMKEVFCNGKRCYCSINSYKKLMRKR